MKVTLWAILLVLLISGAGMTKTPVQASTPPTHIGNMDVFKDQFNITADQEEDDCTDSNSDGLCDTLDTQD